MRESQYNRKKNIARIHTYDEDGEYLMQHLVEPDSVEQFAGMLDKNGKEIYEGDILGCPEDNYFLHEAVIFAEGCFMVKDDYTTTPMCAIDTQYRAVIGSIHDTPDLLNGK